MIYLGVVLGIIVSFIAFLVLSFIAAGRPSKEPDWHERWQAKNDIYMQQMIDTWSRLSEFLKAAPGHHTTCASPKFADQIDEARLAMEKGNIEFANLTLQAVIIELRALR